MCNPAAIGLVVTAATSAYSIQQQRGNRKAVQDWQKRTITETQVAAETDRARQRKKVEERREQVRKAARVVATRDLREAQAAVGRIQARLGGEGVAGSGIQDMLHHVSFAAGEADAMHEMQLKWEDQQMLDMIEAIDLQAQQRMNAAAAGLGPIPQVDYASAVAAIGTSIVNLASSYAKPDDGTVRNPGGRGFDTNTYVGPPQIGPRRRDGSF